MDKCCVCFRGCYFRNSAGMNINLGNVNGLIGNALVMPTD